MNRTGSRLFQNPVDPDGDHLQRNIPVSYTHLMKNFGEFFDNQIEYANTIVLSRTQMMDEVKLKECIEPVSYTHLDVYKRQVLYYADVKQRIPVDFTDSYREFDNELKDLLCEMRTNLREGIIPPIRKGQQCSGCSMKDLCMPSSLKKSYRFQKELQHVLEEQL